MKIALCLSGYFGSTRNSNSDGKRAFDYIEKNILNGNDVDVFIHTWDLDRVDEIKQTYKKYIKKITIQPQYDFNNEIKLLDSYTWTNHSGKLPILSQAYGRQKSIQLKKDYEINNNFIYDWVIYSRFDLGLRDVPTAEPKYRCCEIKFNSEYDNNFFYTKYWNQLNQGFADMWLYSNSKNMDIYSEYYDSIFEYSQKDSEYIKTITTDWPDSNPNNEFSNEIFRKNKSDKNTYFPLEWVLGNNHTMLKWFLIEKDFYPKRLRFPIDTENYNYDELKTGLYEFNLLGE